MISIGSLLVYIDWIKSPYVLMLGIVCIGVDVMLGAVHANNDANHSEMRWFLIFGILSTAGIAIYVAWFPSPYLLMLCALGISADIMILAVIPRRSSRYLPSNLYVPIIYVTAWHYYRQIEPQVPRAWLFENDAFQKHLKRHCVSLAMKDADGHGIKMTVDIDKLTKDIPSLFTPYDWSLADSVTDSEIKKYIPDKSDETVNQSRRMAWDQLKQEWTVHWIPR